MGRTKSQIYSDIQYYDNLKRKYDNLIPKLRNASSYLGTCQDNLSTIKQQIGNGFLKNGERVEEESLSSIESYITKSKSKISATMLPYAYSKYEEYRNKVSNLWTEYARAEE